MVTNSKKLVGKLIINLDFGVPELIFKNLRIYFFFKYFKNTYVNDLIITSNTV